MEIKRSIVGALALVVIAAGAIYIALPPSLPSGEVQRFQRQVDAHKLKADELARDRDAALAEANRFRKIAADAMAKLPRPIPAPATALEGENALGRAGIRTGSGVLVELVEIPRIVQSVQGFAGALQGAEGYRAEAEALRTALTASQGAERELRLALDVSQLQVTAAEDGRVAAEKQTRKVTVGGAILVVLALLL